MTNSALDPDVERHFVAIHEATHAVVGLAHGELVGSVHVPQTNQCHSSIRGLTYFGGVSVTAETALANMTDTYEKPALTEAIRRHLPWSLVSLLAAGEAERVFTGQPPRGDGRDRRHVHDLLKQLLADDFKALPGEEAVLEFWLRGVARAEVARLWPWIVDTAEALLVAPDGRMDGEDILELWKLEYDLVT